MSLLRAHVTRSTVHRAHRHGFNSILSDERIYGVVVADEHGLARGPLMPLRRPDRPFALTIQATGDRPARRMYVVDATLQLDLMWFEIPPLRMGETLTLEMDAPWLRLEADSGEELRSAECTGIQRELNE